MITASTSSNINILTYFHIALSTQDSQATIAPATQAIGRVPVNADIARSFQLIWSVAAEQQLAKILEFRVLWVFIVRNLSADNLGPGCASNESSS